MKKLLYSFFFSSKGKKRPKVHENAVFVSLFSPVQKCRKSQMFEKNLFFHFPPRPKGRNWESTVFYLSPMAKQAENAKRSRKLCFFTFLPVQKGRNCQNLEKYCFFTFLPRPEGQKKPSIRENIVFFFTFFSVQKSRKGQNLMKVPCFFLFRLSSLKKERKDYKFQKCFFFFTFLPRPKR